MVKNYSLGWSVVGTVEGRSKAESSQPTGSTKQRDTGRLAEKIQIDACLFVDGK